jgi:septum formation protein
MSPARVRRSPDEKIVLASASPRRVELLASAGIEVDAVPSRVPEDAQAGETATDRVRRLAETKARSVAAATAGRFFIGADTVVVHGGEVMGKPRDSADAERMLRTLSGGGHAVITGYAISDAARGQIRVGDATTLVYFKALSPAEITGYVAEERPYDKAGAYAIQGRAAYMVRRIEGSYTNVVGLPLCETVEALVEMGAIADA